MGLRILLSNRELVGVGDRALRPMGGGVALSAGSSSLSESVVDRIVLADSGTSRLLAAVSGRETLTLSGEGVAEVFAGAGESLS